MIYDDIKNFNKQFLWEPKIENGRALKGLKKFIVVGMGGSHFAADFILAWKPQLDIIVWSNYGLPPLPPHKIKEYCVIASSYSGNTEETIDGLNLALKKKLPVAVMASGGKLIAMAQVLNLPYVVVPSGIQPRSGLGYIVKATLALMGERQALRDLRKLEKTLNPRRLEKKGKDLAKKLKGSVPVIYGSPANYPVIYNWKIRLNETGKIPAFYNMVPEMNHNEMNGFDLTPASAVLSKRFHFIFLEDRDDHPRIIKRMKVMRSLFAKRGFRSEILPLRGKSAWEKFFSSINLADWMAYYTAKQYGAEPEPVRMVEEFKKLIA